ncbi:MAG: hypothetical protein ACM3O3_01365 [Syntrophothermus sp.]
MNISEEKIKELKKEAKQYLLSRGESINGKSIENAFNLMIAGYIRGMNDILVKQESSQISRENSAMINFQDNYS